MLIRSSVFRQIGLLREDFFLYLEETDFNLRAQAAGWKIAVCTRASIKHLQDYKGKTARDHYLYRRNEMLLSRIHHRGFGKAMLYALALEKVPEYLKVWNFRAALWHLVRIQWAALAAGLLKPIKSIPLL